MGDPSKRARSLREALHEPVELHAHDPRWPDMFERERRRIEFHLPGRFAAIRHIGSTAVAGLLAKPVIDMMPIVRDIRAVDRHLSGMAELGYVPRGEYGLPGRRYFSKDTDDL